MTFGCVLSMHLRPIAEKYSFKIAKNINYNMILKTVYI